MTDLTSMTIAEAKAGLASKSFTSLELTDAHLDAIEAARPLNAFIIETPEKALAMARRDRRGIAKGEGGPLARHAARHQGSVLHQGRADHGGQRRSSTDFVPPYESTVTAQSVGRAAR